MKVPVAVLRKYPHTVINRLAPSTGGPSSRREELLFIYFFNLYANVHLVVSGLRHLRLDLSLGGQMIKFFIYSVDSC